MGMTAEDRKRVADYQKTLGKYPKPSVTADIVALRPSYSELAESQWRENPKFAFEILLIRRGQWPHEGAWALPGGFMRGKRSDEGLVTAAESIEECARRELREETALEAHPLIPIGTFSKPGRDMRAWIISNAFVTVYRQGEGCQVKGGDDAADAKWLRVVSPVVADGRFELPFHADGKPLFTVSGTYVPEELGGGTVTSVDPNPLAFDHGEILATAFLRLLSFDLRKLAFLFLPEKFTLSQYINIYQYLTHDSIRHENIPNFRRQLTTTREALLEPCVGEYEDLGGRAHAPAQLFRRK